MDSDVEYEAFQITEDDLLNEFSTKRRRKFRKEDAIYGMWAEQDSDDENKNDYTKGISFVTADQKEDEDGDMSDADEEDIDQQVDYILSSMEQKKLEDGGSRAGLGQFQTAALEKNRELHMFPTQQQQQPKGQEKGVNNTVKGKKRTKKLGGTIADKRKKELMISDRDFGKWERHTTGFGSKMLQKMGYVPGKGLGRRGEGIVNPVKASKVKELGQASEKMPVGGRPSAVVDSEEEEEEETFQKELEQWRILGDKETSARPKYNFKTLDELREDGKKLGPRQGKGLGVGGVARGGSHSSFIGGESNVKVIDMTGRTARVLSSYDDLKEQLSKGSNTQEQMFLPELLHNLELLVEKTEHEILQNDRQYHYNQDLTVNLTHERSRLREEILEEEEQIEKLSQIMVVIDMFEQRLRGSSSLSLMECEELLSQVQQRFPMEYRTYELSSLAIAVVFPIFKSILEGWDILRDPVGPTTLFHQWKALLREEDSSSQTIPDADKMDPYDRLIWEVWMPKIRQVLSNWAPKTQVESVVDLIQAWMPLVPDWILNNILDNIILPRLQMEVDRWDPTSDPMPIHLWIHPWQPLMVNQLEILYPTIRRKLGVALNNLQPMDYSPHVILKPWTKVFTPEVMEAFLARTVVPKLAYCLQSLVINPQDEHIGPVKWVLSWTQLIPIHHFVEMFTKYFFPKWLQILATWLSGNPNYDEVTKWYGGWKGLFPKEMLSDPLVKSNFNRALSLMDHAAHGTLVPGMKENMVYFITSERRAAEAQRSMKVAPPVSSQATNISFKDVVEKKAEEFGILFMPSQKKYEGKTLYTFGSASVYIDRGVLFVMRDHKWTPISLEELIEYVT